MGFTAAMALTGFCSGHTRLGALAFLVKREGYSGVGVFVSVL